MTIETLRNHLRQQLSKGLHGILSCLKSARARASSRTYWRGARLYREGTIFASQWSQAADARQKKLLIGGVGAALIVAAGLVWWAPQRHVAPLKADIQRERSNLTPQERLKLEHDARKLENEARTTLVQAVGGLALLLCIYLSARTWWTTRERQITERFTKAIDQLGETGPEKLAIRLGGIYALERIARDAEKA